MPKATVEIKGYLWDGNRLKDNDAPTLVQSCKFPTYKNIFVELEGIIFNGRKLIEAIEVCLLVEKDEE